MEIPKPESIEEYLSPANFTGKLVRLPKALNPFDDLGVVISAKILWENPVLNGKFFPAYWMLKQAREEGRLKNVHTLVEATSGNMAIALCILARYAGLRVIAIVPPNIAPGKLQLLEFIGVLVQTAENGIEMAKKIGEQPGYLNLFQYGNQANPDGYYHFLAPNLWHQTGGKMTVLSIGMGTTGTIQGLSRYLREQHARTLVLGAIVNPGESIAGVRTDAKLKEIAFNWGPLVDDTEHVGMDDAMMSSLNLSRFGILGGPSSGFTFRALIQFLERRKQEGTLDALRNADGQVEAVFLCFDPPQPYMSDYPKIKRAA